jgi:ATPase subunit of ABC transporter with duplicated ATPase domains
LRCILGESVEAEAHDFDKSAYQELAQVLKKLDDQLLRKVAASMLLGATQLASKIGLLSEGQKGLLMFAYLRLQSLKK